MANEIEAQAAELAAMATALFEAGQVDEAEGILSALNAAVPAHFATLRLLGLIAATKENYGVAADFMGQAAAIHDRDALVHNVLSVCHFKGQRYQAALDSADRAILSQPNFGEAFSNRGNALNRLGRSAEALIAFERALAILPGDAEILVNMGNALRDLDRPTESLARLDQAIGTDPRIVDAHYNRGNTLQDLGRHRDAIESYDRALAIDPGHVDTHWNRSLCHLLLGDFDQGWPEYEWRWRRSAAESTPRDFPFPLWLGQADLAGKSILLHCEQGLGDSIQFIRYAPAVARLGARVHVEAFEPLVGLFGQVEGVAQVSPRGAPIPPMDFHCPLMSLPLALGSPTPTQGAPYLRAPELPEPWRGGLGEPGRLKVGVVFSGRRTHKGDHRRSLSAATLFAALPRGPAYSIIQTELRETDAAILDARDDARFLGGQIGGFTDTAALCVAMDLVITVDTSVAHLAGALGKPTWILLPFDPDWRWGLGTDATPWYDPARLYRQAARGDWAEPLGRVRTDLEALLR